MEDAKESKVPLDIDYKRTKDESNKIENKKYQSLIGALIYIATNTRVDIAANRYLVEK